MLNLSYLACANTIPLIFIARVIDGLTAGNLSLAQAHVAASLASVALELAHGMVMLGSAATLSAFGNGLLRPTLTTEITQVVGRHQQGVVLGLTQSLSSISLIDASRRHPTFLGRFWVASLMCKY